MPSSILDAVITGFLPSAWPRGARVAMVPAGIPAFITVILLWFNFLFSVCSLNSVMVFILQIPLPMQIHSSPLEETRRWFILEQI